MNWDEVVAEVTPYVVKIETPNGHGTGFACLYNADKSFCGIATARHVVAHADEWQQPIRIHHLSSSTVVFLRETERVIFPDFATDSAVMLVNASKLKFPETLIPLLPVTNSLAIGTEVGWLGFPAVAPYSLCFFSGNISARQEHAYLIDGVAINGVSGGPVMYRDDRSMVHIVGTISAYVSNRATGEALPGLSIARDVSYFHDTITQIKSWDEAERQKREQAEKQPDLESAPAVEEETTPEAEKRGAKSGRKS